MSNEPLNMNSDQEKYYGDCTQCFGLCCVALPYAQSADFAFDKAGGTPCRNLQTDNRCGIHRNLRTSGLRGCTVYDCFGAGQKVSQHTYGGKDWRDNAAQAEEMYKVFPIMQQLYEVLYYLDEALHLEATQPIHTDLRKALEDTKKLTDEEPKSLLAIHVPTHRAMVSELLLKTSELVRANVKPSHARNKKTKGIKGKDFMGAKLRGADLRGSSMRGAYLIAADLRDADMRKVDFIGADLRDADLSGADLSGSIFLTQVQVNSAKGSKETKLPVGRSMPLHWLNH